MSIKITKQQAVEIYKAIESAADIDVEFASYQVVHDLALNKKSISHIYEAIKLLDRPTADFKKYLRVIDQLRIKFSNDHTQLKAAMEKLNIESMPVIDAESDRRENFAAELEREITIENIRKVKASDIKGQTGKILALISKLEPILEFDGE